MEPTTAVDAQASTTEALVTRFYTDGTDPFGTVEWETRDAWPDTPQYHNPGIMVPKTWSQNALNIVSKLYLAKAAEYKEKSIRRLIERITSKYTIEGLRHGYFSSSLETFTHTAFDEDPSSTVGERVDYIELLELTDPARIFYDELCYILLHQLAAFNSPVWFNVGRPDRKQQCSACFILSVDDNTGSIMKTATREAWIFKGGSGSGFDVSRIRGSMEPLSAGGTASGPVSFMRLWDAGAGTFKSGGTTRRAAKLVKCDVDHPDIMDFIECKPREEDRLRVLAESGMNIGFDMEGERNVAECTSFQNANNSVGVPDAFMEAATSEAGDGSWELCARRDGSKVEVVDSKMILDAISEAAWKCADPGMLYMDTINRMHTTPMIDGEPSPIRSSNPCGEYLSNDDTSCNLASINILKFIGDTPEPGATWNFATDAYRQVVDVMTMAMDISVSFGHFPDPIIEERSRKLRQLGLGYSNMGAAIMAQGMPYDSDQARDFAASVTALNTGRAYRQSALMAKALGPFHYFEENRTAMLCVIDKHRDAVHKLPGGPIANAAWSDWQEARHRGAQHGFRNAQASVLAPAGTISYLMDCDTTGIEPAFTLVTHKQLAGGGSMVLVNQSVRRAAEALGGYSEENLKQLAQGDISCISPEDLPTFHGANEISWQGHIKMLAAVQPFVSGGISKTINMDEGVSVDEVREAYELAWRLGVKDLALYRNNSKVRQVHSAHPKAEKEPGMATGGVVTEPILLHGPESVIPLTKSVDVEIERQIDPRRRLPRTCRSVRHKIHIRSALGVEHEGYLHAGMYDDGSLGEIFIDGFGKSGGFTQNALGAWATDFSIALQYGVPMEVLLLKHAYVADETGGMVIPPSDKSQGMVPFRTCSSIVDYISRWLVSEFGDVELQEEMGVMTDAVRERKQVPQLVGLSVGVTARPLPGLEFRNGHAREHISGPPCPSCGSLLQRTGSCHTCPSCGYNSGCG